MQHATRRRIIGGAAAFLAAPPFAQAQMIGRPARIGWLTAQQPASLVPYIDAMRSGLSEFGYVEGRNLQIDFRYGNDDLASVPGLARELAALPVDVIAAQGAATYIIAKLGLPVPIVYCISADPIAAGLADSLTQPRGNMTGLTFMLFEFAAKRIELLREMVPGLKYVAVVGNPEHAGAELEGSVSAEAGRRTGLRVEYFPTRSKAELEQAFVTLTQDPPQAISLLADGFAIQNRQLIMDFAMRLRIPVISGWPVFAQSGALCTYGPRLTESYRRLANYAVRVLRGAKPAELPIERPTKFELVINMRTAKTLGLTMSRATLARADEVIG